MIFIVKAEGSRGGKVVGHTKSGKAIYFEDAPKHWRPRMLEYAHKLHNGEDPKEHGVAPLGVQYLIQHKYAEVVHTPQSTINPKTGYKYSSKVILTDKGRNEIKKSFLMKSDRHPFTPSFPGKTTGSCKKCGEASGHSYHTGPKGPPKPKGPEKLPVVYAQVTKACGSLPKKRKGESEAQRKIRYHMKHKTKHPGGDKQAIAIGLHEAGVARKAEIISLDDVVKGSLKKSLYDSDSEWLNQFKGTSLFDEAANLLEEEIDIRSSDSPKPPIPEENSVWRKLEKQRLKRQKLSIKLARQANKKLGIVKGDRTERRTMEVPITGGESHTPKPPSTHGEYVSTKPKGTPKPFAYNPKKTGPSTRRKTVGVPILNKAETGGVLGKTGSGKTVMAPTPKIKTSTGITRHVASHQGFSSQDHTDAARMHNNRATTLKESSPNAGGNAIKVHQAVAREHFRQADINKAEGSRGGKVIGHTKSGKAVYSHQSARDYKDFSAEDHSNASRLHYDATKVGLPRKEEDHHYKLSDKHEDMAQNIRLKGNVKKGEIMDFDDIFKSDAELSDGEIKVLEVSIEGSEETVEVPFTEIVKSLKAYSEGRVRLAKGRIGSSQGAKELGNQEKPRRGTKADKKAATAPRAGKSGKSESQLAHGLKTGNTTKSDDGEADVEKGCDANHTDLKKGSKCEKCSYMAKSQDPSVYPLVQWVKDESAIGDEAIAKAISDNMGLGEGALPSLRNPLMEKRS